MVIDVHKVLCVKIFYSYLTQILLSKFIITNIFIMVFGFIVGLFNIEVSFF